MDDQEATERNEPGIPWQEIAGIVLRRWKLIAAVFAAGVLSATGFALMRGPIYRASAKLMVTSDRAHITVSPDPSAGATVDRLTDQDLNAEAELLRSPALVHEVLAKYRDAAPPPPPESPGWLSTALNAASRPLDGLALIYQRLHGVPPPSPFERWVRAIARDLSVAPIGKTTLIEVAYTGGDPRWAARFVNDVAQRHVERHVQLNRQSEALRFLESQRELLSDKLRQSERALQEFYERAGTDSMPEQQASLRTQLTAAEAALREANTQSAESSARVEFLAKEIRVHPQTIPGEPILGQGNPGTRISSRVLELELQRSQLLSKFAPNSLTIQDLDRQLAEAKRMLAEEEKKQGGTIGVVNPTHQALKLELAQTEAQLAALRGRTDALRKQIIDYRAKLEHLDSVSSEQERLNREVTSAKESLATYLKKVEAARFSNALDESRIVNVTIVEPAAVPISPMPSKTNLIILLGAVMSLAAGVGLAFVTDRLDPAVKSAAEAQKISGLPILADIPG